MYQQSMFENAFKDARFVGRGCSAMVHAIGNTGWVVKYSCKDATLNYLEWCIREQTAGRGMRGMPEIDTLVHTDVGYCVTMREYTKLQTHFGDSYYSFGQWMYSTYKNDADYIGELIDAFNAYASAAYGYAHDICDDTHGGNIMMAADGTFILTDPCCGGYQGVLQEEEFTLQ